MVLTLLADADTLADRLGNRTKLLGEVAEAANAELAGLVEARVEAEEASREPPPPSGRPVRRRL